MRIRETSKKIKSKKQKTKDKRYSPQRTQRLRCTEERLFYIKTRKLPPTLRRGIEGDLI